MQGSISKRVFLLVCILVSTSIFSAFVPRALAIDTTVKMDLSQIVVHVNDVFNENVTLLNVTNLYGWQFDLYWNRTVLNCTQANVHVPDVWNSSYFVGGPDLKNDYNASHGRYCKFMCGLSPASPFNGSMVLATLTFKALNVGSTTLNLEESILADYTIFNPQPIPHLELDATVTVLPLPFYMRSDQHTINNGTMYKIMATQTANTSMVSRYSLDPENEYVGCWGIRVWRRSANGTETELTFGSPVAVVSRLSGAGLQSANWTCPATSMNSTDSIVVRVYYGFDFYSYLQCAQFSTIQLNATSLCGQTWNVYYYTQRMYYTMTHRTYIYYYWDNNCGSRIENVNYS